jgi:hypothetical protein
MSANRPTDEPSSEPDANDEHPAWCVRPDDTGKAHDHFSAAIIVDGPIQIVVEVVKMPEDTHPLVSILPRMNGSLLRMEPAQALAVAGALEQAALTVSTGDGISP